MCLEMSQALTHYVCTRLVGCCCVACTLSFIINTRLVTFGPFTSRFIHFVCAESLSIHDIQFNISLGLVTTI